MDSKQKRRLYYIKYRETHKEELKRNSDKFRKNHKEELKESNRKYSQMYKSEETD